jgi:hypothetical protein
MKKWLFGALACAAFDASASCGAAFCLVNTDWSAQGGHVDEGLTADLRYETVTLDQPRTGRDAIAVGQVPRHHDEVETKNRNWIAALDWNFAPRWGVNVSLPYVDREHTHIHNHQGGKLLEQWSFRDLGDARVQGRYVNSSVAEDASALQAWGFTFGVKLPTGKHDVTNAEGDEAERTLQPGTGTTDAVLGAFWHGAAPLEGWSWFTRAGVTLPMTTRDEYRPGRQLQLDAGVRYAASTSVGLMLQVNGNFRGRDSGANAEPEDSGQRQVFVSPGISWNVARDAQLYAFVQLPIYQAVNGVQLTADWSALAGVSFRF